MERDLLRLYEIEGRLNEAVAQLREQQDIVSHLEPTIDNATLLRLHSTGLKSFCWLEKERELFGERIF